MAEEAKKEEVITEEQAKTEEKAPEVKEQEKTYTQEEVDALFEKAINKKFAQWERKKEKEVSEAERLANLSAEEKTAEEIKSLKAKVETYEAEKQAAEMVKEARTLLNEGGIVIPDKLVENLISGDAEETKNNVEAFSKLFNSAVSSAVTDRLKGAQTAQTGGASTITKDSIMKIEDRKERQRLINENLELFGGKN